MSERVFRQTTSEESLWIWSIRVIDDQLWCCVKNRIEIRDSDLFVDRIIAKPTDDRLVYDVTECNEEHVYIATSKGIFQINKTGCKEILIKSINSDTKSWQLDLIDNHIFKKMSE